IPACYPFLQHLKCALLSLLQIHRPRTEVWLRRRLTAATFLELLRKLTAGVEEAPASSRSGLRSYLEEPAAAFHAALSRRAGQRQELPRERAIASARRRKGVRGGFAWAELREPQAGVGRTQPPAARILPEPSIQFLERLASAARPAHASANKRP